MTNDDRPITLAIDLPADWAFEWVLRLKAERNARNIPPRQYDALVALAGIVEAGGRPPSDAEVAEAARCCPKTVQRARNKARELGMLEWEPGSQTIAGQRRKGRNAYSMAVPDAPVVPRPNGQKGRTSKTQKVSQGPGRTVRQQLAVFPAVSVDLLAASRQRMHALWMAGGREK